MNAEGSHGPYYLKGLCMHRGGSGLLILKPCECMHREGSYGNGTRVPVHACEQRDCPYYSHYGIAHTRPSRPTIVPAGAHPVILYYSRFYTSHAPTFIIRVTTRGFLPGPYGDGNQRSVVRLILKVGGSKEHLLNGIDIRRTPTGNDGWARPL